MISMAQDSDRKYFRLCDKNDRDHYFPLLRRIVVFKLFSKTIQLSNFRVEISVQKS